MVSTPASRNHPAELALGSDAANPRTCGRPRLCVPVRAPSQRSEYSVSFATVAHPPHSQPTRLSTPVTLLGSYCGDCSSTARPLTLVAVMIRHLPNPDSRFIFTVAGSAFLPLPPPPRRARQRPRLHCSHVVGHHALSLQLAPASPSTLAPAFDICSRSNHLVHIALFFSQTELAIDEFEKKSQSASRFWDRGPGQRRLRQKSKAVRDRFMFMIRDVVNF